MTNFATAWPIIATITTAIIGLAGLIQTILSIAKSRYELRKLRLEDQKLQSENKQRQRKKEHSIPIFARSDYYYQKLDVNLRSLVRWIFLTAFLAMTGLSYVYLTLQLYGVGDRARRLRGEIAILHQANDAMGDALSMLRSMRDRLKREREKERNR